MNETDDALTLEDWQRFVLANGFRAHAYELAAVLGRSVEDVERVRQTGACTRLDRGKDFTELFTLWHGRQPADQEWPLPRKVGAEATYEWHAPEVALLAGLVGQLSTMDIARALTARLRSVTGDPSAERSVNAVQVRMNLIGMQSSDVLGGITTSDAGREIGSMAIIRHAIASNEIRTTRIGRLLVIPHEVWSAWKSKRISPPEGYVQLSTVREALGIKSDKLSEFARMGYVPTAIRCNPYGVKGPTTQFGTWYITASAAEQLLSDRRAGKAMPWHGKPMLDNLKTTFKLWESRKHPPDCESCVQIWGSMGEPKTFEEYVSRYPGLAFGAKRHLTMVWTPGLTVAEVAANAGCSVSHVRRAIASGLLKTVGDNDRCYISRTDATRWIARKCPTGDGASSWISLETASKHYGFTKAELRGMIGDGILAVREHTPGGAGNSPFVGRHQCGQLRERRGFTDEEAARRVGVTVARLHKLLEGVQWRQADGIPLSAVHTVIKRLQSREGHTLEEAADELGVSVQWVKDRKDDGTIRVSVARWDRRRLYITGPMMDRLRHALRNPEELEHLSADWLRLSDAALEAGVSAATLIRWAVDGELDRREWKNGWRYHRDAVRARARDYWLTVRFHRAVPPAWLADETSASRDKQILPPDVLAVSEPSTRQLMAHRRS